MCANDTNNFLYISLMNGKEIPEKLSLDTTALMPGLSVDCVAIGFEDNKLKVLILKWNTLGGMWTLPGGFVFKNEDLNQAATRVLKERTGIKLPFLEQFHTFGSTNRNGLNKTNLLVKNIESFGVKGELLNWFSQRFVTAGYVSFIDIQKCDLKADFLSAEIKWVSIEEIPDLIMDHNHIVKTAMDYIKNLIHYLPVGITLLPEKFTMKELQFLYEAILEKKLDRGNFQRKMLKLDIFIRHEKMMEGKANKAPYLYSIDKEKYEKLLEKGYGFAS